MTELQPLVLVVDDEVPMRRLLKAALTTNGYRVVEAETARDGLARNDAGVDLVLLDYRLPDEDGLSVLKKIKERDADRLVILLTGNANVSLAVQAMKQGAYHYAVKPFDVDEIAMLVEKALETRSLRHEVKALRASQAEPYSFDRLIGDSAATVALKKLLRRVAAHPSFTVLLTGESGVGKDLAAKVIHYNSSRVAKPFMNITCSALSESLLETELFGHERGAFTGADRQKLGLLEVADGGTVFLDEIGEMVVSLQAKLLRFLEEHRFKRVGGAADVSVDVSIIAATNRRLADEVKRGRFREDLFYRLNVLPIELPPLRERSADIPLLVDDYLRAHGARTRRRPLMVSAASMQQLQQHTWPGNIRELRNVVERAILLTDGEYLDFGDVAAGGAKVPVSDRFQLPQSGVNLDQLERSLVEQALERAKWNKTDAAALLGLNRDQIRYRIEKFQIERSTPPSSD